MKLFLNNLLKNTQSIPGFENLEAAKDYLCRYLLSYIHIELSSLPKQEWEKTLKTWAKICMFANSLLQKSEEERQELYRKYNFDQMMIGIAEDVRHTLIGAYALGLLKKEDKPYKIIPLAASFALEDNKLMEKHQFNREILEYIKGLFDEGRSV
ncbi:hypothetical protein [Thermocrinis minervae]|uniref:Uncharacterized protein n=1 Tax=Thermocrinis minervae TaxID=381751 RepID=A0A1M6T8H2_9AQUI|nr:hypothetical protein [Thermocrinis minervae]SHK53291.1 hypothetical protein SAMN05444391_1347 [Thermocrinis minervae]